MHAGQAPCPRTGAVMPPVYLTSTYAQASPGNHQGFEYTRSHNPTRYALERAVARLEGSHLTDSDDASFGGFAFSSGMAAISCLLDTLSAGDRVLAMDDLYGGSHRLFRQVRSRSQNLQFDFADLSNPDAIKDAVTDDTRLIWIESPSNPMLKLADLQEIANVARDRGILCACDNTFASPMLQRPLELGFDIVMHSATKYLGGHSDVVAGMLVTGDATLAERIRFHQNSVGSILGPFDSYLVLRGIKTLEVRMNRHCENASAIADMLASHDRVRSVIYPGHSNHPQHELACRQMRLGNNPAGGGMITMTLDTDLEGCRRFLEAVKIFTLAESLGGVESLVNHPAIMTHASVPEKDRAALGIDDSLVRLSVGIETLEDLMSDLQNALDAIG